VSPRSLRLASILGGVILAAVALLSWSQSWIVVVLSGQAAPHPDLAVSGDVAAPAVAALAVAALAAFGAVAITGRFFRVVLAVLVVAIGASAVLSAVLAITDPTTAVEPAVTEATSISGTGAIAALIESLTLTAWPFVAAVSGTLLALLGIAIVLTGRSWPETGRRYETVRLEPADAHDERADDSSVSDWDELSGGADPTSR